MLAVFAAMLEPKAKPPAPEVLETFQEIVRGREAFVAQCTALLNQLGDARTAFLKQQIKRQLKTLEAAIARLEAESGRIVAADPALARALPDRPLDQGHPPITAVTLLANFPEIGTCSAKQSAMIRRAGTHRRRQRRQDGSAQDQGRTRRPAHRHHHGRRLGIQLNPALKALYDRLVAKGKERKLALTAVMRKLIVPANTLIREDRLWKQDHAPVHA
jgi:transposase